MRPRLPLSLRVKLFLNWHMTRFSRRRFALATAYLIGIVIGFLLGWSWTMSDITNDFWWWPWDDYTITATSP